MFNKLLAVAAVAVTVVFGGIAATGSTAHAATPSCGTACVDVFNDQFGNGVTGHPGYLMDSYKQGVATGTPIILFRESNSDPALDFTFENEGTVQDFFATGLVSAATAMHYGCVPGSFVNGTQFTSCVFASTPGGSANLNAYEIEYTPFGAPTGQCVGLAATPVPGEKVTLQPCGVSGKTVWIVDQFDGVLGKVAFGDSNAFNQGNEDSVPLINGANMNFSHPFVMTYPASGEPSDKPRPVIYVANLSGHFDGIFPSNSNLNQDVDSNQLWDAVSGAVTS